MISWPNWLRPRFSLRLLLLAVTGFAVGFPTWYRWPYAEPVVELAVGCTQGHGYEVKSWQRQWGGGREQQGWEWTYDSKGELVSRTFFRNGRRSGPYERYDRYGGEWTLGQYLNDRPEGVWRSAGKYTSYRWQYVGGKRHGEFRTTSGNHIRRLWFERDRLTLIDGQPQPVAASDLSESPCESIESELDRQMPLGIEFVETPLGEAAGYLSEQHSIPFFLAPEVDPQLPITADGGPFGLTMREALAVLTVPSGLAWSRRYGGICFMAADESRPWRDPTGASEFALLPGAALEIDWERPVDLDLRDVPLAEAIGQSLSGFAISLDARQAAEPRVSIHTQQHPLKDVLGILLYQTGCRCELRGLTLTILPPRKDK